MMLTKQERIKNACEAAVYELDYSLEANLDWFYWEPEGIAQWVHRNACGDSDDPLPDVLWDNSFITKMARLTAAKMCVLVEPGDGLSDWDWFPSYVIKPDVNDVIKEYSNTVKQYKKKRPFYVRYIKTQEQWLRTKENLEWYTDMYTERRICFYFQKHK